ncbi:MAG: inorganic phosphate transporter [Bacillota bacterium]|nr:inorganic phosphate transporter [Bacillota bacterium]
MDIVSFFTYGNVWLYLASIAILGVAYINGWSDAPNAIATAITTRCMKARSAIIMAALCNFVGVLAAGFFTIWIVSLGGSSGVAGTISSIVSFPDDANTSQALMVVTAGMASVIVFSIGATIFGYPSSESNEIVGGLTGAFLVFNLFNGYELFQGVGWNQWLSVLIGLVGSAVLGFFLGYGFTKLIELICKNLTRGKTTAFFTKGQIASAALMSVTHGVQDGLKLVGIFLVLGLIAQGNFGGTPTIGIESWWIVLAVGIVISAGTLNGGYKVIKTVGSEMASLQKYQAFASDLAGGIGLLLATYLGVPVSTGQVKMSAITGAGASKGLSKVKWSVAGKMVGTWLIVLPGSMILSGLICAMVLGLSSLF